MVPGVSASGFSESFPIDGLRSLYGTTKLASELVVAEYLEMYSLRGVIDRCGVIAGPWQMGKVDQGFLTHWVARHVFGGSLAYKGFGGTGKQVRDVMHVDDLARLVDTQIDLLDEISGETFNIGGGIGSSVSLHELTELCSRLSGNHVNLGEPEDTHPADVQFYVSDCCKLGAALGWEPNTPLENLVGEVVTWFTDNQSLLRPVFESV